jgi:hypothetical protein
LYGSYNEENVRFVFNNCGIFDIEVELYFVACSFCLRFYVLFAVEGILRMCWVGIGGRFCYIVGSAVEEF